MEREVSSQCLSQLCRMLILLSPAKTLKPTNPSAEQYGDALTTPVYLDHAKAFAKAMSAWNLAATMIKLKLSETMGLRAMRWHEDWQEHGGHAAGWTFQGDAFKSLDLASFREDQIDCAQRRLRILNAAYGMLRPLDRYRPVRLEMGHKGCPIQGFKSMSEFWRPKLTAQLQLESETLGTPNILNLASAEYGDVALHGRPDNDVISCAFLERKGGALKSVSAYAKAARGAMARYVLTHDIEDSRELEGFSGLGYRFDKELSSPEKKVFTRTLIP